MTFYWFIGACALAILVILFIFKMRLICAFFAAFLVVLFLRSGMFIVYEGSQVVITQFGDIVGKPYTKAGLYFKAPIIWKANFLDKRYISEEEKQPKTTTKDGYIIAVNLTFFWKITGGDEYISSVDSMTEAKRLLRNIVSGAVREAISKHTLLELIRTTKNKHDHPGLEKLQSHGLHIHTQDKDIKVGRNAILANALKDINQYCKNLGVHVTELLITKVKYTPEVQKTVENRMILERMREASRLRSEGRSTALRINGLMVQKLQEIIAPAKKNVLIIKGKADAYAANVESQAYLKNRDLYNYWDTLKNYKNDFNNKLPNVILSTDNPFLNFMTSPTRRIARPNAKLKNTKSFTSHREN